MEPQSWFLQLPANLEGRVLEPRGISAASEVFLLSLPQHSGRGLKAADLSHRVTPNPTPGNHIVIFMSVRKTLVLRMKPRGKMASPAKTTRVLQGIWRRSSEETQIEQAQ